MEEHSKNGVIHCIRLVGNTAIVTGGGGAIGQAIALRLASEGARILVADLNLSAASETVRIIGGAGGDARAVHTDVAHAESAAKLAEAAVETFGHLDILVNCAGVLSITPLLEVTEKEWERILSVNAKGTLFCLKAAARQMVEEGHGGAIVNVASIMGRIGNPLLASYGVSKAAVIELTRVAAIALAPYNIRVNAVCPGIVDSPMWDYADTRYSELEGLEPGEPRRRRLAQVPLGREGTPEDVAATVAFLASSDAAYITGQALNVCGGTVMH